jgi:hypothetical protein
VRALVAALLLCALAVPGAASAKRLELGLSDSPGGAKKLRRTAHFGYRYQYLAGGVNTGDDWTQWNPDGSFASMYVDDSRRAHVTPVFSYYTIRQSAPGNAMADESRADLGNLRSKSTMRAWYADLRKLFKRVHGRGRVVVQIEPDLWGYGHQASRGDSAGSVPAAVASTGLPELKGLPNTMSGFAQAIVRLRNRNARNVKLGYHLSIWGTKTDIGLQDPPAEEVDRLARRSAAFYRSLHVRFDLAFAEFSDRDAGFKQIVYGDGGASWWNASDFSRDAAFDSRFHRVTKLPIVKWQIPLGNTLMLAMNNTWGHYQDNRVQWLLGDGGRSHLRAYRRAGVIALLFGAGATGTTCACDQRGDGVTNPKPVNGNTRRSLSADDDGGYFKARARAYYKKPLR